MAEAPVVDGAPPEDDAGWAPIAVLSGWIALCTVLVLRKPFDTDAWWHLRTGEWIVQTGGIPRRDPFSWTALGWHWRLESWLFDATVGNVDRVVPGRGAMVAYLVAAFVALGFCAYGLARRAGARRWPSVAAACFVEFLLVPYAFERPQMLSYLFFAATLALLPVALAGSRRALGLMAVVFVLWVNYHFAFVGGLALVGAAALGVVIQQRRLWWPATVVGVCALAGLVNPIGYRSYAAAFQVRGVSRMIIEWHRASIHEVRDVLIFAAAVLGIAAMVRTGRWRRLDLLLPVLLMTALFADAIRNGPFLLLVLSAELALGAGALRMPRLRRWAGPPLRRRALRDGALLGIGILLVAGILSLEDPRGAQVSEYPVRGVAAIPAGCRLLNEYDDGGYIIEQRGPGVLVSEDGRNDIYGVGPIERQQMVIRDRDGARAWLDARRVDCVLLRADRPLVRRLEREGWIVVTREPSGVLLVRPGSDAARST